MKKEQYRVMAEIVTQGRADGLGWSGIAEKLNRAGFRTVTGLEFTPGTACTFGIYNKLVPRVRSSTGGPAGSTGAPNAQARTVGRLKKSRQAPQPQKASDWYANLEDIMTSNLSSEAKRRLAKLLVQGA